MSLKSKLVLSFFLAIFLSIASLSAVIFININKYSRTSFEAVSTSQLHLVDAYITEIITEGMKNVKYLASLEHSRSSSGHLDKFFGLEAAHRVDPKDMSPVGHEIFKTFRNMAENHPAYGAVFLGSEQGGFLQYPVDTMPENYDPRKRPWYKTALASQDDVILSSAYMSTSGSAVSSLMTRVMDTSGQIVGIIGVDMNLDTLTTLTSELKLGRTGYIMLLEGDGTILSNPHNKQLNFKKAQDTTIPALQKLAGMKQGTFESQIGGKEKLITVMTSKVTGWKLAYIKDSEEVFEASYAMLKTVLAIGAVLVCLLLVGAWGLALTLLKPLKILTSSAESLADGNLDALPRDDQFTGEFLTVHLSFKKMVEKLFQSISLAEEKARDAEEQSRQAHKAVDEAEQSRIRVEEAHNNMLQVAQALEKIVEQVTSASQELSTQIEEASHGSVAQRDRIAGVSTAMEQMISAVLDIASNAGHAAESADEARQEAEDGGKIVTRVLSSIEKANSKSQAMSAGLNKLGKQAEDIGQIMTVITDIADQTNLLALNAAIEAARAGEAGRGFAVVADEVRKLAEKTMSATREVGESVTAIQEGAGGAISDMDEASQLVNKSTEFAQQAGEALRSILSIVESTADQVQAIAAASEEQSASSEEINRNAEEVNQIAARTSESMQDSTHAVHDLTQLTRDMMALITQLKQG